MSTALEELKLLLLQDNWDENKEAMVDALQLLLGVAEMKTRSISRMMFMDPENHLSASTESMFSDFNSSHERITFDEKSDDENTTDKKTETFYTADENYDVSCKRGLIDCRVLITILLTIHRPMKNITQPLPTQNARNHFAPATFPPFSAFATPTNTSASWWWKF